MFRSHNIQIFLFLKNAETLKYATSSETQVLFKNYTFDCFFRVIGSIKMKFAQVLVQRMTNISSLFLRLL